MRTTLFTLVLGATAAAMVTTPAYADGKNDVVGTYDVKYDEVSNNCTDVGITFTRGTLDLELKKSTLVVDIERVPMMTGVNPRAGRIKAQSKITGTSIQGLDGRFSVAGRVDNGVLQLVFVAEYYVKGKALCTQSWNVSGLRQAASKTSTDAAAPIDDAELAALAPSWPF